MRYLLEAMQHPRRRRTPTSGDHARGPDGARKGAQPCAFPSEKESGMNLFTIIGVVVVVLFIVGYIGFR